MVRNRNPDAMRFLRRVGKSSGHALLVRAIFLDCPRDKFPNVVMSRGDYVSSSLTSLFMSDFAKSPIMRNFRPWRPCCSVIRKRGEIMSAATSSGVTRVGMGIHPCLRSFSDKSHIFRAGALLGGRLRGQ